MKILYFVPVLGLLACASPSETQSEPEEITMRHTLSDDDRRMPGPVMTSSRATTDDSAVLSGPDIEVADLSEGRTHIAQGGVQVTLLSLEKGQIRLAFKKDETDFEVTHRGSYAEGTAFDLVYSADVADTVYLRLEERQGAGPIDLTSAGKIAAREIAERPECSGATGLQPVAQDNGTVVIRAMKDTTMLCSVRVGLYTRSIVADQVITELPNDLRPPAEIQ